MGEKKKLVIVGSGAGGAMAAYELAGLYDVTLLEAGGDFHPFSAPLDLFASLRKTGLFLDERMIQLLLPNMQIRKTGDMVLVNGIGTGGTTTLATGNAVRSDEGLKRLGLDLDPEFLRLQKLLPITTAHQAYWNSATRELFDIFKEMGLNPQPTPKFLHSPACKNCGHCAIGCPTRVKWDTRELLQKAVEKGVTLRKNCRVEKVQIQGGMVTSLVARQGPRHVTYRGDVYILAAGGLGTPVILSRSGIECEKTLFVDPVLCVAGIRKGFGQDRQLLMPFYSQQEGYMLSPYIDYLSFFFDKRWRSPKEDVVSLMIKMADDGSGYITPGKIQKGLTACDQERLKQGVLQCQEALSRLGIQKEDSFLGILNAGHPGGMLPLTEGTCQTLHDPRLPDNLYVADASLFPKSAGLPPILTIMALSLRVAQKVKERLS